MCQRPTANAAILGERLQRSCTCARRRRSTRSASVETARPAACLSVSGSRDYFLGASDPYNALKTTLKAEINEEAWTTLHSDTSRPFEKPKGGRIAVKVINHLGDEVMKVFRV